MALSAKSKVIGAAAAISSIAIATWLFLSQWTVEEAANAQYYHQAMLEVRAAIEYSNERKGLIDPSDTTYLIDRYQYAADQAELVEDATLEKLHPKLLKVWHDTFLPSTKLYLRALKDQDRDLARNASLLQDDWIRWLRFNGHKVDVPPPPPIQQQ
ncbi:MAG: hypothetical protein RIB43_07795 [Rhodospirillaceae bacterium]